MRAPVLQRCGRKIKAVGEVKEVLGQRGLKREGWQGGRGSDREGMKCLAVVKSTGNGVVGALPKERGADLLKVGADLMGAACEESGGDETVRAGGGQFDGLGLGGTAVGGNDDRTKAGAGCPGKGGVDQNSLAREATMNHGEIDLLEGRGGPMRLPARNELLPSGKEQYSRSIPIELMEGPGHGAEMLDDLELSAVLIVKVFAGGR